MRLFKRKPKPLLDEDIIPTESHTVRVVPVAVPVHEDDLNPDDWPVVADPVSMSDVIDDAQHTTLVTRLDRRRAIRAEAVRVLVKHAKAGVTVPDRQRILVDDPVFAQDWIDGKVTF